MAVEHDGAGAPILDSSWRVGDTDCLALVWDGALQGGEQIISSEWIVGDDWSVVSEFNNESINRYGIDYTQVFAVLLESLLTVEDIDKHYASTKILAAVTHRVSITGGRELSRTILIPMTKN